MRPLHSLLPALLATSALSLSLSACREDETLTASQMAWPQTAAASYPADYYGDAPARIPVGRPVSYDDGWAWAERSYALDRAFYDTPPDYGFGYDGYEPWVWQTDDRWAMYGDPNGDDWRYYYYQPGATRPYFIRDADYGYGYDDVGRLVTIFSLLTGQPMPQQFLYRQDPLASSYYQRAYLVREASLRAEPIVITREVWLQQQPVIVRTQNAWITSAGKQKDWVRYRERTGDVYVRAFDDERRRRETTLVAAKPTRPDKGWFGLGRQKDQERPHALVESGPRVAEQDRGNGRDKDRGRPVAATDARLVEPAKPDRQAERRAEREQAQAAKAPRNEAQAKVRQHQDVADAERHAAHERQRLQERDAAQARADKQVHDQQRQGQQEQQQRAQAEQAKAQHGQKAQQAQQAQPAQAQQGGGKGQGKAQNGGKEADADQPKEHGGGKGKKG